jgi:hypothetical protein
VTSLKGGQQARQYVLAEGGAGTQAQAASGFFGVAQGVQLPVELLGGGGHRFGVGLQKPAGFGEGHPVATPFQQALPIALFQLVDVLGNGRLGNEQFLGRFSEAQVPSHGLEHPQAKIGHGRKVQNAGYNRYGGTA